MRRILAAVVLTAAVMGGSLAVQSPAAALSTCTRWASLPTYQNGNAPARIPSTGTTKASTQCSLQRGVMNNSGVTALQESLNHCYQVFLATSFPEYKFDWLVADGDFGDNTFNALKKVQGYIRAHKNSAVLADGGYGLQSRDNLFWWTRTDYTTNRGICEELQ
ncbi:hypothetical protein [Catellatospora vulcania]|uniref:hypothetical protein n=1 Tax=Catellatospora vulcania TaxID=1460450 RepID=UPI0012D43BC7|nr:hypothetical protein [Catellatospora vulcania]